MPAKLIIHLLDHTGTIVEWAHVDAYGKLINSASNVKLSEITLPPEDYSTFVFAPTADILLATADIPFTTQARTLKAIPYALEEQLTTDIEELHFALLNSNNPQPPIAVAVIKDELLANWLTQFQAHKIAVTAIIPDVFALPIQSDNWSLFSTENATLIRQGNNFGFSTETANLKQSLELTLLESESKPTALTIYSQHMPTLAEEFLTNEQLTLHKASKPNSFIELAVAAVDNLIDINLLQGKYKTKHKYSEIKKRWKWPVLILLAWLLVVIAGDAIEVFYLTQKNQILQQQIISIYQQIYPTASPSQPQRELERQIAKLNRIGQGSRFINLMDKTASTLSALKITTIEQVGFAENVLTIRITVSDFTALEELTQQLMQKGLNVKRNEATGKGKEVSAELAIS